MTETQHSLPVQRVYEFIRVATGGVGGRVSTKEIAMATGLTEGRLNGLMREWFSNKGTHDLPFYHIHRAAEGVRGMYWYDASVTRMEGATPLRKPNKPKVVAAAQQRHPSAKSKALQLQQQIDAAKVVTPGPPIVPELYARCLEGLDGVVVGITQDGRVFKGRWMKET